MYCADTAAGKEYHDTWSREITLRKTWKMLSRVVFLQIMLWYLTAFGRIILLDGWVINWMAKYRLSFYGWNASDVIKCVSFVTGADLAIMTIKLFALLIYRARWLRKTRGDTGLRIVRRNPLRWFWMIPAQCLLDILFFMWVLYIQYLNWMEQWERGPVEGHPGPLLLMAAMFCAAWVTIGVAVAACICACVSRYREKHN